MKVDITSTTLEKGIDLAKGFLDKLITPAIEEVGLLMKDQLAFFRFKNQVQILNKSRLYCIKHNIEPKAISLKLLVPLLEHASLEEDESLQDKWAMLLTNLVDSEQNIQNHVFPYLLSQISINEFKTLENAWLSHQKQRAIKEKELIDFQSAHKATVDTLIHQINLAEEDSFHQQQELDEFVNKEQKIIRSIFERQAVDDSGLEEFEIANLIRLGTIKAKVDHEVHARPLTIPAVNGYSPKTTLAIKVDMESGYDYHILTELGELFIKACSEKK